MTSDDELVEVNIVIDTDVDRMGHIVDALTERGLEVDQVLDLVGIVSGQVARRDLPALRGVPGVLALEESGDVGLFPE